MNVSHLLPSFTPEEPPIMEQRDTSKTLIGIYIAYCTVTGCLGLVFYCCLYWYIKAFRRHQMAHKEDPVLFPLIQCSFDNLRISYPLMVVLNLLSGLINMFPAASGISSYVLTMGGFVALGLHDCTAMYQSIIAIISIYRFLNNRSSSHIRWNLTRQKIIVLMISLFAVFAVRDVAFLIVFLANPKRYEFWKTLSCYYLIIYLFHQALLYVGMFLERKNPEPCTSFSEKSIATHIKAIGSIKLIQLIILAISFFIGFQTPIALTIFLFIDIYLVPVVIEITEIKANPNII